MESDPVVQEYPVYLSKTFKGQLYILNYLTLPHTVPSMSKFSPVSHAKIKPKQDKIQLTVPLDPHVRYDWKKEKRKHKQTTTEGKATTDSASSSDSEDNEGLNHPPERDRIYLSSAVPFQSKTLLKRYFVGVIRNGAVHLASVKTVVEVKDKLPYLDLEDENLKGEKDNEAEEITKVNVRFSQARDHASKSKYLKSYAYLKRQDEEEPWIDLKFFGRKTDTARALKKMTSRKGKIPSSYYLSARSYADKSYPCLKRIFPVEEKEDPRCMVPRIRYQDFKFLSFQDQLRHIFYYCKVLRYCEVKEILKRRTGVTVNDVPLLRTIQTVAVLVQGCWAVKSSLIFNSVCVSDAHGILGSEMQRARDIILGLFNENRIIQRKKLCALTRIPIEEVTEILKDLAVVVPKVGWEFIKPFDTDFVETCREVVQRQSVMWDLKKANRNRPPEKEFQHPIASSSATTSTSPTRISKSVSFSSGNESGNDAEKTPKAKKRSNKKK